MKTTQEMITDEELLKAWGNANFSEHRNKRDILANALLKYSCGYVTGSTIECICDRLNLIIVIKDRYKPELSHISLTKLGKEYLYSHFDNTHKQNFHFKPTLTTIEV